MRRKLGRQANSILKERTLNEAVRSFASNIRSLFNPYDEEYDTEFEVPIPGAPDMPHVGLEEGYLKLSRLGRLIFLLIVSNEIQDIFSPIFNNIYGLITQQIDDVSLRQRKLRVSTYAGIFDSLDPFSGGWPGFKRIPFSISSKKITVNN